METLSRKHVNRGCSHGHMLVTHWSKNALTRNLPGESKRAAIRCSGGMLGVRRMWRRHVD